MARGWSLDGTRAARQYIFLKKKNFCVLLARYLKIRWRADGPQMAFRNKMVRVKLFTKFFSSLFLRKKNFYDPFYFFLPPKKRESSRTVYGNGGNLSFSHYFDCVIKRDFYLQKTHSCSKNIRGISVFVLKISMVYQWVTFQSDLSNAL